MDSPPPADDAPKSPKGPDLLWTPGIEADIDSWLHTGAFPFPEMGLKSYVQFQGLSKPDLRLVHHLASVYRDLQRHGLTHCIMWVEKIPTFLEAALDHDFVMSAILAFSATHIAWMTSSLETKNLAYYHRGIALNGLHGAIGNFSEKNSDPILAASILLSWQASDWGGWSSLMQGISTVISSMDAWKRTSRFALYVENSILPQPRTFNRPSVTSINVAAFSEDDRSLQDCIHTLQGLHKFLSANSQLRTCVEEIIHLGREIEAAYAALPARYLFEKLQSLRARLLWMPISLFKAESFSLSLLVISHLYAMGLAIDTSIPELNGAAFGALTTALIDEIDHKLRSSGSPTAQHSYQDQRLEAMMHFPRELASRTRFHQLSVVTTSEVLQSDQQNPFEFQNLGINSTPSTPAFPGAYPLFSNPSTEDLNIPPSPFLLQTYSLSPISRRASQLNEHSSRPLSIHHRSSFGGSSYGGGSPSCSPSYSPAPTFADEEQAFHFGGRTGYHGGFVSPTVWA
ncbi:hypothetical protein MMC13_004125 [Lambiella insularis]|nr:hypothetical protein [Lambiella insularis]